MAELAVGNFVTFSSGETVKYRFQNFFIGETITRNGNEYSFVPFGFSGVTINKTGDGTEASILLPNSTSDEDQSSNVGALARSISTTAIEERWLAYARVVILDPNDKTSFAILCRYYGQVTAGGWDNSTITLNLSTVLDAVGGDVPQRKLSQTLVGDLPTSSGVRLQ
jgi:phage-related protein